MDVEIKIDLSCKEPKVVIYTCEMNTQTSEIIRKLSENNPQLLTWFKGETAEILEQDNVVRIYSSDGKVFAVTDSGEYMLKQRLYELEERLDRSRFVRISNSEIVNLKKVKKFDLSLSGTICVAMQNKTVTYVSRRYVSKIKQILGI